MYDEYIKFKLCLGIPNFLGNLSTFGNYKLHIWTLLGLFFEN